MVSSSTDSVTHAATMSPERPPAQLNRPRRLRLPCCQLVAQHLLLALLVLLNSATSSEATERTVYWNSSNAIFKPAGENLVTVQLQDRVLFVCPNDGVEYYQIYWTNLKAQSQSCSGGSLLFSCSIMVSYLVNVQIFPADPTAPSFSSPVYFYTPSSGSLLGMDQMQGGACLTRNMRLTLRVADSSTPSQSPSVPDAQAWPGTPPSPPRAASVLTPASASAASAASAAAAAAAAAAAGGTEPLQTAVVSQHSAGANNGRLSSRGSMDDELRLDPYRLNLITGCSAVRPRLAIVVATTVITVLFFFC